MNVMGGCEAPKAEWKCENGPGNRPGPLLFLNFSTKLGKINMRIFWSSSRSGGVELGRV